MGMREDQKAWLREGHGCVSPTFGAENECDPLTETNVKDPHTKKCIKRDDLYKFPRSGHCHSRQAVLRWYNETSKHIEGMGALETFSYDGESPLTHIELSGLISDPRDLKSIEYLVDRYERDDPEFVREVRRRIASIKPGDDLLDDGDHVDLWKKGAEELADSLFMKMLTCGLYDSSETGLADVYVQMCDVGMDPQADRLMHRVLPLIRKFHISEIVEYVDAGFDALAARVFDRMITFYDGDRCGRVAATLLRLGKYDMASDVVDVAVQKNVVDMYDVVTIWKAGEPEWAQRLFESASSRLSLSRKFELPVILELKSAGADDMAVRVFDATYTYVNMEAQTPQYTWADKLIDVANAGMDAQAEKLAKFIRKNLQRMNVRCLVRLHQNARGGREYVHMMFEKMMEGYTYDRKDYDTLVKAGMPEYAERLSSGGLRPPAPPRGGFAPHAPPNIEK